MEDIRQLQGTYGVSHATDGDDTYTFTDNSVQFTASTADDPNAGLNVSGSPGKYVMTIWDSLGTEDTIDASAITGKVYINLNAGHFSAIGTDTNSDNETGVDHNVGIAHNADIEHAKGGKEADLIVGNDLDNKLEGGDGDKNDTLQGGKGDDTLYGGEGADTLLGGANDDRLEGGEGNDLMDGGAGYDKYHALAGDTIIDSDGVGAVWLGEQKLTLATRKPGETVYQDKAGNSYFIDGPNLIINDSLAITQYQDGKLGIYLKEEEDNNNDGGGNNNNYPIPRDDYRQARHTVSPLALDLDGDGTVETTPANSGTYFDHGADGFAEDTGWIGADDGLLVRDLNGNGRIDSGRELFGNQTLLANGRTAANGFAALAQLDANQDGKVDNADAGFTSLMIWKDTDGDGYTSEGELYTLAELGVQSIGTGYTSPYPTITNPNYLDPNNNAHKQTGAYTTTAGQSHKADDVWFDADKSDTLDQTWVEIPEDIAALPDLPGYGTLHGLRQAMAMDETGQLKGVAADGARRGLMLPTVANNGQWGIAA